MPRAQINEQEIDAARANGIEPVEFVVAIDALAVIVNPDNPVDQLTIPQLVGHFHRADHQLERGRRAKTRPIVLLSRESNSGTHVYFLEEVVRQGDDENTDHFRGANAADAVLGRHYQRSQPQPERDWLRWAGLRDRA